MTTAIDTQPEILPGLLTEDDARKMAGAIRRGRDNLRALCIEFEQREGWRALSYKSMRACAEAEFGWSWRQFYRQLAAADVETGLGLSIGQLPESHARELRRLPADQRKGAYDEAKQDGKTTAADVREAVERRRQPEPVLDTAVSDYAVDGVEDEGEAGQPWPPGQELCIHGRDLINATCEECEEEAEQVERIPGQGKETPQDAREMAAPSKGAAPTPKPHRIEAPQSTRETVGGDGLGEIDLAEIRRNGDSVGVVMAFYRLAVAAATDEAGGQARRRIVGTLLRQARGQK